MTPQEEESLNKHVISSVWKVTSLKGQKRRNCDMYQWHLEHSRGNKMYQKLLSFPYLRGWYFGIKFFFMFRSNWWCMYHSLQTWIHFCSRDRLKCDSNKSWTNTAGVTCYEARCEPLPSLQNGLVTLSCLNANPGDTFSCTENFELTTNEPNLLCKENGFWDSRAPSCVQKKSREMLHSVQQAANH